MYTVILTAQAEKDLKKLSRIVLERIANSLRTLQENPRPMGVKKLQGEKDAYRVRAGDYRIVYRIVDQEVLVVVIKIAHRREVYR